MPESYTGQEGDAALAAGLDVMDGGELWAANGPSAINKTRDMIAQGRVGEQTLGLGKLTPSTYSQGAMPYTLAQRDGAGRLSAPLGLGEHLVPRSYVDDKLAGRVTISTANPSGGVNGDIWLKV